MITMIWDTIVMDGWGWKFKKLWTFKGKIFRTRRDPKKHIMRKLNAYGFNSECLNQVYKANNDAVIVVSEKYTDLIISVKDALEVWTYLSFNWELQVFVPIEKFRRTII